MILLFEHLKIASSSDIKKRKRIKKSKDSYKIFNFINIQLLSNSKKLFLYAV